MKNKILFTLLACLLCVTTANAAGTFTLHGKTGKTVLADADVFGIEDSAAAWAVKKVAMTDLKTYVVGTGPELSVTSPLGLNETTGVLSLTPWESQAALETWLGWTFTGGISHATSDGNYYMSKDGGWVVGTLIGATASQADYPLANFISSHDDVGHTYTGTVGMVGEAKATATDTGTGTGGVGMTNGSNQGRGVTGVGKVSSSSDTAAAIGGYFRSLDAHAGGINVGASVLASGGLLNYALSFAGGDISSSTYSPVWYLRDDNVSSLSFSATGKNDILKFVTSNGAEKVIMSGGLEVTGLITTPAITGASYPATASTSTATGDINIDGVSADHYYFNNGADAATYTPVITAPPTTGYERGIILTVGGGAGVITMTWTNVSFIGTAGAATTTASKYSHYACFIPSSGNAKCKIIAEASGN